MSEMAQKFLDIMLKHSNNVRKLSEKINTDQQGSDPSGLQAILAVQVIKVVLVILVVQVIQLFR